MIKRKKRENLYFLKFKLNHSCPNPMVSSIAKVNLDTKASYVL